MATMTFAEQNFKQWIEKNAISDLFALFSLSSDKKEFESFTKDGRLFRATFMDNGNIILCVTKYNVNWYKDEIRERLGSIVETMINCFRLNAVYDNDNTTMNPKSIGDFVDWALADDEDLSAESCGMEYSDFVAFILREDEIETNVETISFENTPLNEENKPNEIVSYSVTDIELVDIANRLKTLENNLKSICEEIENLGGFN